MEIHVQCCAHILAGESRRKKSYLGLGAGARSLLFGCFCSYYALNLVLIEL